MDQLLAQQIIAAYRTWAVQQGLDGDIIQAIDSYEPDDFDLLYDSSPDGRDGTRTIVTSLSDDGMSLTFWAEFRLYRLPRYHYVIVALGSRDSESLETHQLLPG